MMDINADFLQWSIYFLIKTKACGSDTKNENISNKELAADLHKPIIKTFENRKIRSLFTDNTWGANPADM